MEDEITCEFSITNFGSALPGPKGASILISLKNSTFKALGAIAESKYKFNPGSMESKPGERGNKVDKGE